MARRHAGRLSVVVLLATAALGLASASASASTGQEAWLQDDGALKYDPSGTMQQLRLLIDNRGSNDLSPLDPESAPQDLRPLILSINGLMERLAASVEQVIGEPSRVSIRDSKIRR